MRADRRAGFTLVELMVAMIAGSFAVIGAYYLSGVSSRAYQEQMRVNETQQALRSAMEQLRRDVARAGYLAVPNTTQVPSCGGVRAAVNADVTPRQFGAFAVTHDGSSAADVLVDQLLGKTSGVNRTRADSLELWGNYATSDAYLTNIDATNSSDIVLDPSLESFRRSFINPATNAFDDVAKARFEAVFAAGRMLRVEVSGGRYFFRDIDSTDTTNAARPLIRLATPLPSCFQRDYFTAVSPVMRVRYRVEADTANELARVTNLRQTTAQASSPRLPGTRRTLLVRREIQDSTETVVANSSRVVLDYAVEFAVDGVTASGNPPPAAWTYVTGNAMTAATATPATATPENFRSLIVTLSSRSTDAEPDVLTNTRFIARTRFAQAGLLDSPMFNFLVFDPDYASLRLLSRVRTLRSEIFLQNL